MYLIKRSAFVAILCIPLMLMGQTKTPNPSTTVHLETKIGLTDISLDYSRPSKKGRAIFGDLVPYDTLWRTGANYNSVITFGDDVMIGKTPLEKGAYEIYTKPGKETWIVYFYDGIRHISIPADWDDEKVMATAEVTPIKITPVETFTLNLGNIKNTSFDLEITWDNLLVPVTIKVPTDTKVAAMVSEILDGPAAWDYFLFARYYSEEKKNLSQALQWVNQSIKLFGDIDNTWLYRQKSVIEADMGDYFAAIHSAENALKQSIKSGDVVSIKINSDAIKTWSSKL